MKALGAGPGDNGMSTSIQSGSPMDLERAPNQNGGAAATALVATSDCRVPEAMPARLTGKELETLQPRP